MALLEVKDLRTYFYTDAGVVRALDGVTFQVDRGEALGVVGESGSGKSVTALSLMRLIPDPPGRIMSGSIVFKGNDMLRMSLDQVRGIRGGSIAMVFQDPLSSLNPVLTIGRQIAEAIQLHQRTDRRTARRRAIGLLDQVGIPSPERRARDYPHQFSGGMRQRVMIAMAISCQPDLILADEPTTALDVTIQAQILDLLKGLATESKTAFMLITHDLGVVARMTQRVHVMYAGKIVETARTSELFANPRMPYTWGLLRSIPRIDVETKGKLTPIEGAPPDLAHLPSGCRFEPRCSYRRDICGTADPDLLPVPRAGGDHQARCWGTQDVAGGGWLRDVDWRQPIGETRAGVLDATTLTPRASQ